VPLADLLVRAAGETGRVAAAVAAVVLTLGTVNAYLSGAAALARQLAGGASEAGVTPGTRGASGASKAGGATGLRGVVEAGEARRGRAGTWPFLAASALAGLVVIGLYAAGLVGTTQLIGLPTTLFLVVYLGCTVSAARTLRGWTRAAAVVSALAVLVVLAFCGWPLAVAAAVAGAAVVTRRRARPAG
jgi:amino acid efflux transporter